MLLDHKLKTETGEGIELVLPSYPGGASSEFDVSFTFNISSVILKKY